jgi:hypothetical protein
MDGRPAQTGRSAIGTLILLLFLAYGVYVAIQYAPQHIETATVTSILDNVAELHRKEPMTDTRAVKAAIDKQLYINQINDFQGTFSIVPVAGGGYTVTARYDRSLNLLFTTRPLVYEKTVTLD